MSDFRSFLWVHLGTKHAHLHGDLCKTKQRMWLVGHFLNSADEPIIPQSLVVWITMKSGKFTSNPEGENKSLKYIFNNWLFITTSILMVFCWTTQCQKIKFFATKKYCQAFKYTLISNYISLSLSYCSLESPFLLKEGRVW